MLLVEFIKQECRISLRRLMREPGLAALVTLILALGIGATTSIFTLIDAAMLRALPVQQPNKLLLLQWQARRPPRVAEYNAFGDCGKSAKVSGCSFPLRLFEQLQRKAGIFSSLTAASGPERLSLSGNGPASVVNAEIVAGNYFSTIGVGAALGRTLEPGDDLSTAAPVAILSYGYWLRVFGGSKSVIGQSILLNNVPFTVVGVADRSFPGLTPGKHPDLWLSIAVIPRLGVDGSDNSHDLSNWWLLLFGRLQPGVSLAKAQAELTAQVVNTVSQQTIPAWNSASGVQILLTQAQQSLNGRREQITKLLGVLLSAVLLLLLVACANVAGLLLASSSRRQREIATCLALGAGRGQIVRQLLKDSILLAAAGSLLGIVIAYWGVQAITTWIGFRFAVAPDWRILIFALVCCVTTGFACGLAPALHSTRINLSSALKNGTCVTELNRGHLLFPAGKFLVVAQVALSVVALWGAGLLIHTLVNLSKVNPGFDSHDVLIVHVNPSLLQYDTQRVEILYRVLQERFRALPGVLGVSYSSDALLDGNIHIDTLIIDGQAGSGVDVDTIAVGPAFFSTMHIPLLGGRVFNAVDFRFGQRGEKVAEMQKRNRLTTSPAELQTSPVQPVIVPLNVVVNEAFVHRYFPNQSPLGKLIRQSNSADLQLEGRSVANPRLPPWEIVGVIGNTKYDSLREVVSPMIFVPLKDGDAYFEIRTVGDPRTFESAVRAAANQVDPNLPLSDFGTQSQEIDDQLVQERLMAHLSGFFGAAALTLAAIGLYGLMSYEVSSQTRKIGIKIALGAQRSSILRGVVVDGIALVAIGAAVGTGLVFILGAYLESILYHVHVWDLQTIFVVLVLLAIVSSVASYIPARKATTVDPIIALRHE